MTDRVSEDPTATTGDHRVDVALAPLDDLDNLDLAAQLDVFTDLQAALALILDDPEFTAQPPAS